MNTNVKLLILLISILFNSCKNEDHSYLHDRLWKGVVASGKDSVTIYFDFDKNLLGNLQGKISIPDQSIYDLEASRSSMRGDSLFLEFSGALNAKVHAKVGSDEISGVWEQGGHAFSLNLTGSKESIFEVNIERALFITEANSVYSQSVDWKELRREALKMAQQAKSRNELLPIFQYILTTLKDRHGFVLLENKYVPNKIDSIGNLSVSLKKAAHGQDKEVVSKQLNATVGYLRIPKSPDFGSGKEEVYNQLIQKHVCELIANGVKSWIIDMRLNTGGSMFHMLGGLNLLLGEGQIGSHVGADGNQSGAWIMKKGNYYNGDQQMTTSGRMCNSIVGIDKVAILTGPMTASSGEAVVIALRNLENSQTFGELTKGRSTSLIGYSMAKDLLFLISSSYYADRKGQVYKNGISPDVLVTGGDNFEDIEQDSKVRAALQWIQE